MSYLAEKCTIIFESKNIINISSIIGTLGIVLIGILTNHLIDALIYEGMFLITRRKLGGYHCKSYLGCISSYLLLFIVVLLLKQWMYLPYLVFTMIIINIVVISQSPVENINNPISIKQRKVSKLYAVIVVLILDMIIMLLIVNQNSYYLTIIYTLSDLI